jgi:hypothetical protein
MKVLISVPEHLYQRLTAAHVERDGTYSGFTLDKSHLSSEAGLENCNCLSGKAIPSSCYS